MVQPVNFLAARPLISAAGTPSILKLKTLDGAPTWDVELQVSTPTERADREGSSENKTSALAAPSKPGYIAREMLSDSFAEALTLLSR